jgi:protein-tyrosine phosphatase
MCSGGSGSPTHGGETANTTNEANKPTNSSTTMSVGDNANGPSTAAAGVDGGGGRIVPVKRQVRTGRVHCRWLYNQAQAARGTILIDTRSREAFEEDTIPSALSIPPMPQCRLLRDVEDGMLDEQKYLFSSKKRKLRDVVLFGDAIKLSGGSPKNDQDGTMSWLEQLEKLLVEDGLVTSVKVLCDGFLTFKYRYPFFTTGAMLDDMVVLGSGVSRTQSGTHNLNYPNEILDGFLFLGNMWHAQSKQVVRHLGITHIVNASLDLENVFANQGVQYFEVKIKDRPEADISAYFDDVFAFIESAKRAQHGRVLVHCTQGISRSATLVIMYLMRAHHWSLVTAVNYAMACRGVVYPNQGFVTALMHEEFRLYRGNSLADDEVDTLLQHQIPDRPIPLQMHNEKSENCANCRKFFSLLEWKHRCSYCRKEFCSKCTTTRLALSEREKESSPYDEARRGRRVCDCCVSRLWKINLPKPRKGLQLRTSRCKHLNVNSMSTFGKPVCISYFEGTDSQMILDVVKIRFGVQQNQIIDISGETGEPVRDLASLPDEAIVLISIGKAGNVKDPGPRKQQQQAPAQTRTAASAANAYGRRYQLLKDYEAETARNALMQRNRFSSEGNMEAFMERAQRTEMRRSNSFHVEKSTEMLSEAVSDANQELLLAAAKFRQLWNLSFPSMSVIEHTELLKIQNAAILSDVMLGLSSLSCGALALGDFEARLVELSYSDADRLLIMGILERALSSRNGN